MYNKLIHGKNNKERIVSIEPLDSSAEIFTEEADGTVKSEFVPNKYWILSNTEVYSQSYKWSKLKGNLYYKYGTQFDDRDEYERARKTLRPFDTYSIYNAKEALMIKDGYTHFKGMKVKDVSVLSFDIESTGLNPDAPDAKVLLISNTFRKGDKVEKRLFAYDSYSTVGDFINAWCAWVRDVNPTIMVGHNIFSFDLPYLYTCARNANINLRLGRNDSNIRFEPFESKKRKDQTQDLHYRRAHIYGREIVDTLFLAIDYDIATKKYESYGLKKIIEQEGLEKKDRVFYDSSKIRFNYKNKEEWIKIKAYCMDDADDSLALYDLMAPSFFYTAQNIPKSYQSVCYSATGSKINSIMCRAYLQDGYSLPKASPSNDFEGAISIGNPGIYTNVFKIDVASLYPSIMIQYEIYDKEKDPQAYFKQLVSTFTELRLDYKKKAKEDKYYDDLQGAYKIFINSCYGFLGTTGLNFNSPVNAAFITSTGRNILNRSIEWAKSNNFIIVNADTDSISISKPDGSEFTADRDKLLSSINSLFPEKIRFEDDGFYKKIIVVKAKNYILWDGNKLKYKGSALKASTKEPALKEFIKKVIDSILEDKKDYNNIYSQYVKEIMNIRNIKRWVTRKTLTDKVFAPKRTNEQKVLDAIEGTEYNEGDRAYFYFKEDGTLSLAEHFDGKYNREKLLEKLYKTGQVFETILDVEKIFPNYKLKRNADALKRIYET